MKQDDLVIIASGGGMKCSWGAGVFSALANEFGLTKPRGVIGCSGGAGSASYFVAEQYPSIPNIWGNLLCVPEMLDRMRFWEIINIDYLIDEVTKKQDPLDERKIHQSRIHYVVPALDANIGKVRYFSNQDATEHDFFELMRATMAMPLAYKLHPRIKAGRYRCCDSDLSASAETHLNKAVEMGAKKILVIDCEDGEDSIDQVAFDFWLRLQEDKFRRNYEREKKKTVEYQLPEDVEMMRLHWKRSIPVSTLCNDGKALKKAIKRGYRETKRNRKLKKFLKK